MCSLFFWQWLFSCRLSEGAKADSTAVKITSRIPNVSVVKRDAVFSEISSSLDSVFFILKILAVSVTLFTVISLAIIFPLAVSSRTAEFSILRILGAAHKKCAKILLYEALFISVAGGLSGIALACLLVFPFCTAIDSALSVPLVFPPPAILFLAGCAVDFQALILFDDGGEDIVKDVRKLLVKHIGLLIRRVSLDIADVADDVVGVGRVDAFPDGFQVFEMPMPMIAKFVCTK